MDKKKEIITCINYAKYVAFISATICVLIFQFVASPVCLTIALALYVTAFGLTFAELVIHTVELFNAGYEVKKQNADETVDKKEENEIEKNGIDGEKVEVVHLKSEKAWSVIGSIFMGLFTIFTFVVLVLY